MKKINKTRCPDCWVLLEYSDAEEPDAVILNHLFKNCEKHHG